MLFTCFFLSSVKVFLMSDKFTIPVRIVELDHQSFHLLVEASIDGLPLNLVIDTGASRTVFDHKVLEDQIKTYEADPDQIQSAGIMADPIESRIGYAKSFRLGKLELKDFKVVLIDLNAINNLYLKVAGTNIHGLLGSDFLLEMNAVIDYEKARLKLKNSK